MPVFGFVVNVFHGLAGVGGGRLYSLRLAFIMPPFLVFQRVFDVIATGFSGRAEGDSRRCQFAGARLSRRRGTPRFIARAEGAFIFDVDGRRYIDYVGSYGPAIVGHAHPGIVHAVQQAAETA